MGKLFAFAILTGALLASTSEAQFIADHSCAVLEDVPASWIEEVQDSWPSHYAHTSHGSQLTWGLTFIEDEDDLYDHETGSSYLPSVPGAWCIFDGQETATYITPDLYWETGGGMDMTRAVLDNNPGIRASMWSWCTQVDYYSEAQVQAYLDSMSVLESEYPDVTFIYMTGNAQGTGSDGYNRWLRNNQIRDFCSTGGRVLYDFADLDCWWFDPSTSEWEQHTYEYGGYQIPAEHPQFYGNEYGHTTAESCRQKGEALWYMMAVLAGWQGTGIAQGGGNEVEGITLAVENPCSQDASIQLSSSGEVFVEVSVYTCDGRLFRRLFQGMVQEGTTSMVLTGLSTGFYLVTATFGENLLAESLVSIGSGLAF